MNIEDKRAYLKAQGWRRCDRAIGPNKSQELWMPPGLDRLGMQPIPMKLESAYKRQLKQNKELT
jgi:hypothetical protein